jgi:hypothetical protein
MDLLVFQPYLRSELPPVDEAAARATLARWQKALGLNQVALGMSPDEVIAACSLAGGRIARQMKDGVPDAVRMAARAQYNEGRMTYEELTALDRSPPVLQWIECGIAGNSTAAIFARPPARPVVIEVMRFLREPAAGQLGKAANLEASLRATFGAPVQRSSERLPSGEVRHFAWAFPRARGEIACVVPVDGAGGGKALEAGIPAGGPCAPHVTARVEVANEQVKGVQLTLMNPDVVALAHRQHLASFPIPGIRVNETYLGYEAAARRAGLPSRDDQTLALMAAALAQSLHSGGGTDNPTSSAGKGGNPGLQGPSAAEVCADCRSKCEGMLVSCGFGESQQACYSRQANEKQTCRGGCACF